MRLNLTGRILIGGGFLAAFLLLQFALAVRSFQTLRHDTGAEQRAQQSISSAIRVELLVAEAQTAVRGYAISGNRSFLAPWFAARSALPVESAALMALAPGSRSSEIDRRWRSYVVNWSAPLVTLAARNPELARARIATGQGNRLVDQLRTLVGALVADQTRTMNLNRQRVAATERGGVTLGATGLILRAAGFAVLLAILIRWVVAPIRRIALATRRVADGDLDVEVPEGGAGEVGQLASSFNEMSRSLRRQQRDLAEQNVNLERLANVLRAVLDSTVDGILLSDAEGNVQLANRPVVNLTRELKMSFEGPVVDRLLSVADRVKDPEVYRAAMERLRTNPDTPTFDEFEDTVSNRVFQGFTAPVHDDRGGFIGRIWTLREVTQERELDRLKDDFVATVSHELRTPLTSMMGFLEMIREGEAGQLTDEQKRFLAIVYRSSERLQRLVGDLLFVARLDAAGLQLQFGAVRIDEVARELVESSSALARSRELVLSAELGAVPSTRGDRERIAQLVGNLLSNALKFTPAGGSVTVRTFAEGGYVVLEVDDTGIGIPEPEQERLFQRFFRSSVATEHAIPGTGLGLVISKAIAEAHGGSISVVSKPGGGTRFRFELPLESEEAAA